MLSSFCLPATTAGADGALGDVFSLLCVCVRRELQGATLVDQSQHITESLR